MKKSFGFTFQYREVKEGDPIKERFFIETDPDNALNAAEIAMLKFLTKHNYYSGKVLSVYELYGRKVNNYQK